MWRGSYTHPSRGAGPLPAPSLLLVLLLLLLCGGGKGGGVALAQVVPPPPPVGSVKVVTVASDTRDAAALLASGRQNGVDIRVLGEGVPMPWPTGLRTKIMLMRDFVRSADAGASGDDLLFFVDAWDTMVLAEGPEELKARYLRAESKITRPIIFAPEEYCYPSDEQTAQHPGHVTGLCAHFDTVAPPGAKRRYLNSGLYAGRVKSFRSLFERPIPDSLPMSDQPWFQQQFKETELIGLDYNQILFAAHPFDTMAWTKGANGHWLMQSDTDERPAIVHWNGPAHWCLTKGGGWTHNFINGYQRAAIKVVGVWHAPLHCDALQVLELVGSWLLNIVVVARVSAGMPRPRSVFMDPPPWSRRDRRRFAIGGVLACLCAGVWCGTLPYYVEFHGPTRGDPEHKSVYIFVLASVYCATSYAAWQRGKRLWFRRAAAMKPLPK
jgi:hypothetical protein